MNYRFFVQLFLIFAFAIAISFAHGDEKHGEQKPDTVTVVNGDTIAINGIPVDSVKSLVENPLDKDKEEKEIFELNIVEKLAEHLHNKIIHFPIAFVIAGFLLTLIGFRNNKYENVIKILVALAAIFGVAAFFTGNIQSDVFLGDPKEWVMNTHKTLGILTIISTVIWVTFLFVTSLKKYSWLWAVIAVILVSITGFYGGVVAH